MDRERKAIPMIRNIWKGALAAGLACAAAGSGSALAAPPKASKPQTSTPAADKKQDEIVIKDGKSERRCVVLSSKRQPDGSLVQQVKALDNGEIMTLTELAPGAKTPAPAAPASDPVPSAENPPHKTPYAGKLLPNLGKPAADVTEGERPAGLFRGRERPTDPPVTPQPLPAVEPSAEKGSRPGLFSRIFGRHKSDKAEPVMGPPASYRPVPVPAQTAPPPLAEPVNSAPPVSAPAKPAQPLSPFSQLLATPPPLAVAAPRMSAPLPLPSLSTAVPELATTDPHSQHLAELRSALQPSAREAAAEALAVGPQAADATVRGALLMAVREDPAPTVRASCVRCLVKQGIRDDVLSAAVASAQGDADSRVRAEVEVLGGK
jgi:hypothetical protein